MIKQRHKKKSHMKIYSASYAAIVINSIVIPDACHKCYAFPLAETALNLINNQNQTLFRLLHVYMSTNTAAVKLNSFILSRLVDT